MAFRMTGRDPEEDKAYAEWLMEQANPQPPAFAPIYTDPRTNPIALEHGAPEAPAYGDPGRPRSATPDLDELPPGVEIPAYWKDKDAKAVPPASGTTSSGPTPSPMLASRSMGGGGGDVHVMGVPTSRPASGGGSSFGDDAGMILAMFADMAINKGRGGADILKFYQGAPDRDLDREYKKAQIANQYAQATRPYGRGMSPEQLELQRMRIEQAQHRIDSADATAQEKAAVLVRKRDPNSPETRSAQDAAIAAGLDEKKARSLTAEQIETWRPQLGTQAAQLRSDSNWWNHFASTSDFTTRTNQQQENWKRAREGREEERDYSKEQRAAGREDTKSYQNYATDYAKEHESDLTVAGLIQDLNKIPGGAAPKNISERLRVAAGSFGLDPNRLEAWQVKKLITEQWSRKQSGAAISGSENENFAIQTGTSPTASREQVETAFRVMQRVVARRLKAGAIANPDAAREIGEIYELGPEWFPKGRTKKFQERPAQKSAADITDDDLEDL
jgi:hypothetical protein